MDGSEHCAACDAGTALRFIPCTNADSASQLYATILACLDVVRMARLYTFHLTLVTLAVSALYIYRDMWPLVTFTTHPEDEAEGALLWAKIGLVFFIGIIEPLFEPYPYIPVDLEDPMPEPNPEQTASIISFMLYSFLDPVIWLAYRIPHLAFDQLPPLCDYDYMKNLIKRSYPVSFTSSHAISLLTSM